MRRIAIELQEAFFGGGRAGQPKTKVSGNARPAPEMPAVRVIAVNPPLDFELKGLDHDHPYIKGRAITGETARFFGIGVADRGSMKGRLAIPLHDISGRLVGYAGRILNDREIRDDNPKCVYPERRERNGAIHEFRKGELVYNRSRIQSPVEEVIVVQSFMDLWWLHQSGFPNVVSTMGPECSERQAAIIAGLLTAGGRAWIVPGGRSGESAGGDILRTIASRCACRWVPEFQGVRIPDLTAKEIGNVLKR